MHQPDYRNYETGDLLAWVYLHPSGLQRHGSHLEAHPSMKRWLFVPVRGSTGDYAAQFASGQFRDPLLRCWNADLEQVSAEDRIGVRQLFPQQSRYHDAAVPDLQALHDMHETLRARGEAELSYLRASIWRT